MSEQKTPTYKGYVTRMLGAKMFVASGDDLEKVTKAVKETAKRALAYKGLPIYCTIESLQINSTYSTLLRFTIK